MERPSARPLCWHQFGSFAKRGRITVTLDELKKNVAKVLARSHRGRRFLFGRLERASAPTGHPFDVENGTETSGNVPSYLLGAGYSARALIANEVYPYFGCQPNCARRGLDVVADPARYVFFDLGCGMGRAAIIASEYPFRRVVGVEMSADLSRIARRNADIVAASHRDRPIIEILEMDATVLDFPPGNLVIFLYNPFGPEILEGVVAKLEQAVRDGYDVILIYENPVHHEVVDRASSFSRCFGAQVACRSDERPFQLDADEAVVVWRSPGARVTADHADFAIETVKPGWRTEVRSA
jgi:SAM-dependent methyltransferase